MTGEVLYLETAADVTAYHLSAAESTFDDWFADDERIDWPSFLDKFVDPHGLLGPAFDIKVEHNPAVEKIQRHVRGYRDLS